MRYAILLYGDEAGWATASEEEQAAVMAAHGRFAEAVRDGGGREVEGAALEPSVAARTLRWTGEEVLATDGPYAEAAEHLGGLYVVDAPDLDALIGWCRLLPHSLEIRPVVVHQPDAGDAGGGGDAPDAQAGTADAGPAAAGGASLEVLALLYGDESVWPAMSPAQQEEVYAAHGRFAESVAAAGGAVLGGQELDQSATATTMRLAPDGGWLLSDGPFAEAAEQLGGYYHLAVPDMAAAERLLHGLPGEVTEIRPVAAG